MPNSEGIREPSDNNKNGNKNRKRGHQEIQPLDVQSSLKKLREGSEQGPQARETDQRQHPNADEPRDFSKGKPGDPYGLTEGFTNILRQSGNLTDGITRQLEEVTQKLAEGQEGKPKADVRDRTDAINPQHNSQKTLNRLADGAYRSFEDYMKRIGRPF